MWFGCGGYTSSERHCAHAPSHSSQFMHLIQLTHASLCTAGRISLVLDPLEHLFPMHRDVLRRIDSDTNVRAVHAKDRHDDVGTDPNDFANSPREYQHVRLHALR